MCIIETNVLYACAHFMEVKKNNKILHQSHNKCRCNYIQKSSKVNRVQTPLLISPSPIAGKPSHTISTKGENINICWSPNGHTIAVGNKVSASDNIEN